MPFRTRASWWSELQGFVEWGRHLAACKRDTEVKGVRVLRASDDKEDVRKATVTLLAGRTEHGRTWPSASGFTFMSDIKPTTRKARR